MAMTEQQVQLAIAAKSGDVKGFEQLYAIYYEKVYGFARMILKNDREAEDVLQETFITAWRKLDTLESPQAFSVWIQVIAKNLCNMQLRRKDMMILLDADQDIEDFGAEEESAEFLPAAYAERADLRERLAGIIDGLSDVQRQAITLYYFNELSVDEISEIMECSPGTVKSRLFLARKTIKTEVEEQERKTGQKFFGVAGIPMLPFGNLVHSYMESMAIGQGAANASLNAIANAISGPGAMDTAAGAEGTMPKSATNTVAETAGGLPIEKEGIKMDTKMSLKTKIVIGIVAAVAAVAVIMFVAIPAIGGTATEADSPASDTGDADEGDVPGPEAVPEPDAAPEPEESAPAETGEAPGEGAVYDYNDLSTAIADLPRKEALDEMYILLEGYWITEGNQFVGFFIDENGDHEIEYGLFQSSFGARGRIVDGHAAGTYEAALTLYIPAVPENAMDDAKPERTETIHIDIGGLNEPGGTTIRVKSENLDIGGWYTYEPGGYTLQQAFENWAG